MIPVRDHDATHVSNGMISDERFPKREHVLKSKDFGRAYKKGLSYKYAHFFLYVVPNDLGHNRLGFSISAHRVKLAVSRARIRRLFREAYRRKKNVLKKGYDMVLVVKKDLGKNASLNDVNGAFVKLVKDSGLLL